MAKIVAGDGCNEVCQKALNIFGGYGLMTEFPVQRYLRDSYFPPIGGDERYHAFDRDLTVGTVIAWE
jgi:alkylation response protein AidB-like acyl-CoA dehydrogenase